MFLTKECANVKEIHQHTADVYGDSSQKYSTVAKWSIEFKCWGDSLEDDPTPGRPANVISHEVINRVERPVLNHRQIKVRNLLQNVVFVMEVLYKTKTLQSMNIQAC